MIWAWRDEVTLPPARVRAGMARAAVQSAPLPPHAAPFAELPNRVFQAVLFNLDGTLIDSDGPLTEAWVAWAGEFGIPLYQVLRVIGSPVEVMVAALIPEGRRASARHRIECLLGDAARAVRVMPGATELLAQLAEGGVAVGVVTSATRGTALDRFRSTGLPRPHVLVTCEDTRAGKPDPAPYAVACEQLDLPPSAVLVVESELSGLRAARAAGVGGCVAVPGLAPAGHAPELADHSVDALASLDLEVRSGRVRVRR